MKKSENIFLYLVVLGGRANKANIELHDVRWVLGSKIEDTFDELRKGWFGNIEGLHIDKNINIENNIIYNPPTVVGDPSLTTDEPIKGDFNQIMLGFGVSF